jgi:hypothetical protein
LAVRLAGDFLDPPAVERFVVDLRAAPLVVRFAVRLPAHFFDALADPPVRLLAAFRPRFVVEPRWVFLLARLVRLEVREESAMAWAPGVIVLT